MDDKKIITRFRDEMLKERNSILQNYADNTKEKGEMYYVMVFRSKKRSKKYLYDRYL